MKRRTLRTLRPPKPSPRRAPPPAPPAHHHHVYVVLLRSQARRSSKVRRDNPGSDPAKPCLYVGMTGLDPAERLENHRQGIQAARVVQRHGLRLVPELYAHLNPMPYEAAATMERDLAEDLRRQGYTVTGGH